jgi:hypothetical protein
MQRIFVLFQISLLFRQSLEISTLEKASEVSDWQELNVASREFIVEVRTTLALN